MKVDMIYCKRLLILSVITQAGETWVGFKKAAMLNVASFLTYHLSYADASADSLSLQLSEGNVLWTFYSCCLLLFLAC